MTIETIYAKQGEVSPVISEALRYMGYMGHSPDEYTASLIDECARELIAAAKPVCCCAYTDIKSITDSTVDLGFGDIRSRDLARHLKGCRGAYLFAATIGIGADRLIAKYSRIKPAKGVIIDALGSSMIEDWCDKTELAITAGEDEHCSRFSAGYGDFPLAHQLDFMRCLDMNRQLGITLSDSLLMTPTKSVTAVIGLGASNRTCGHKCLSCGNKACIYRDESK